MNFKLTYATMFNPPAEMHTRFDAALDEVLAHFSHYRIPIESAMPRVTVSVRVSLGRVLDLTDGPTRFALRTARRCNPT